MLVISCPIDQDMKKKGIMTSPILLVISDCMPDSLAVILGANMVNCGACLACPKKSAFLWSCPQLVDSDGGFEVQIRSVRTFIV